MENEGKITLYELLAGIIVCFVVCLLGNLLAANKLTYTLGLTFGSVISFLLCLHMYSSLNRAMLYDQKTAAKKLKLAAMLRMLLMFLGLLAAVVLSKWISAIGTLLGLLCLKFSAYLQPLTHKFFYKIIRKGR